MSATAATGHREQAHSDRRRWYALILLSAVQFMVVLDIAIVNVALPSIQVDLGFSEDNLQWVVSAYALVFGGFLLLGGRTADVIGRKRLFLVGPRRLHARVAVRRARVVRGVADHGARAAGPRRGDHHARGALDRVDDLRGRPRAQHRARRLGRRRRLRRRGGRAARRRDHRHAQLGVDLLRERPGRRARVRVRAVPARREPRRERQALRRAGRRARHDGPLVARLRDHAGGPARLAGGRDDRASSPCRFALLAGFVAWELRHPAPLMRFGILRTKTVAGANVAGFILGTAIFAMFLMLTLYMQQVLGYSPMKTGVGYLAVAGSAIIWSAVAAQLVNRLGVKPVLVTGHDRARRRARLVHAGLGRRLVPDRPAAGLPARRRRSRLLVRADLDRGARRRAAERDGARVRPDQHVAADRRRTRHRRALDDRDLAHVGRDRVRHRRRRRPPSTASRPRSWRGSSSPSSASSPRSS